VRRDAEFKNLKSLLHESSSRSSPFAHFAPVDDYQQQVGATARAIVATADRARSGQVPIPAPTDATAKAILRAAAIRDAGGHIVEPPTGVAATIIAAGKQRRGEKPHERE
jgi:hypothetical protein